MKNSNLRYSCLLATLVLSTLVIPSCVPPDLPDLGDGPKNGAWSPGAGRYHPESFRNHTYTFELNSDDKAVDITLESTDADVALWVYDHSGQKISYLPGGRSQTFSKSGLKAGHYKVVAGTYERAVFGSYTLKATGNDTPLILDAGLNIEASGAWATNGGGRYHPESYRNHHYTVEVLQEGSTLDFLLNTSVEEGALWVYNPQGDKIAYSPGGFDIDPVVDAPKKGVYEIVVGTYDRGIPNASYKLNVNGQIANLKQIPAADACLNGNIADGAGRYLPDSPKNDTYTLDLTEDNRALDFEVQSPDFNLAVWVYGPKGDKIAYLPGGSHQFFVTNKDDQIKQGKGTYKIVVGTYDAGESGSYSVCVAGQFVNFKKI